MLDRGVRAVDLDGNGYVDFIRNFGNANDPKQNIFVAKTISDVNQQKG